MPTDAELLAAYDADLRGAAEMSGPAWDRVGPLWRSVSSRGGFVSYESLAGYDVTALVAATVAHFAEETAVPAFEWKTRGHDDLPGLHDALVAHGLVAEEVETVMVGDAAALAVEVPLRAGLVVRRADTAGEAAALLEEATALQAEVFGVRVPLAEIVARGGGRVEVWVAQDDAAGGRVVSCGRLDVVPGTRFAGLWGGATSEPWRGLGIYRALTAARARSALARGVELLQSDCTEMSRPILARAGLRAVTTTTPYVWTRPDRPREVGATGR